MEYRRKDDRFGERGVARLVSSAAVFFVLVSLSILANGCEEAISAVTSTRVTNSEAVTTTSLAQTTVSSVSLHERIQQEQAARNGQVDPEPTTSTTGTGSTPRPSVATSTTAASSIHAGRVLVLSDGTRLSAAEADALDTYLDTVSPLTEEQQRLNDEFDMLHQSFGSWTTTMGLRYEDAVADQQALLSTLEEMEPPPLLREAHEARILSAQEYAEATRKIYDSDPSGVPTGDADLLGEGINLFVTGYEHWQNAERLTQNVSRLVSGGHWE